MATRPGAAGRPEIDAQDAGPAQVVDERLHFAARQADVAVHADAVDPEQRRREREGDALVEDRTRTAAGWATRRTTVHDSRGRNRLRREPWLARAGSCAPPAPSLACRASRTFAVGEGRQDSVADGADRSGAEGNHQVACLREAGHPPRQVGEIPAPCEVAVAGGADRGGRRCQSSRPRLAARRQGRCR